ncbi:MAG: four helix bundle protein [Bacteroidota bacterium]
MRNFRELRIWRNGMEIVRQVYIVTPLLPDVEKYGLKSQLQRAAVSIPSNIAEGCSRDSERDFRWFLHIAIGSAFELETQLTISNQLNLIPKKKIEPILRLLSEEQKMINSFISAIKTRQANT